jgi:hypothetical protein
MPAGGPGRVAHPLNFLDSATTRGAPLFAHFAKGGHDAAGSADFDFLENLIVHTPSYPPLQKAQERGTRFTFFANDFKAGPPAQGCHNF